MAGDKAALRQWLRNIRDVLNRDWDPIGVFDIDENWPDVEYESYVGKFATLLRSEADDEQFFEYMQRAELEHMALTRPFDRMRAKTVIEILRALPIPPSIN
ncbi:MAG TPA: hypothetical protein VMD53_03650 [Rhizomicrobium sp.]|nr:hypothetical protein [Rhizomicrobium sp.]